MYHSLLTYDSIPEEHRSLVTTYANLISFLGLQPVTPDVLYRTLTSEDPVIDHQVLPEYVKGISLDEVNDTTTSWPNENGTIVKVRRYDDQKMYYVDHYLLLIDALQRAVVDSYDGIIKNGEGYGEPAGWVRYSRQPERDTQADREHIMYTVQAGENLWDVARKLNIKFEELRDYNTIDDPRLVKEGYVLHLPIREAVNTDTIRYEILNEPEAMHVSRSEGTRKLMFGNADTFSDIKETGRLHAPGTNHTIYAIAYVDLNDSDVPAAYYMDKFDAGDIAETGRPRYLTGFNHSHLAVGHVTSGQPVEIRPEIVEKLEEVEEQLAEVTVADIVEDVIPVDSVENVEEAPLSWKNTIAHLRDDGKPETYKSKEDFTVYDADGIHPPRPFKRRQEIALTYGVYVNGELFGLPQSFVEQDRWYLFPLSKLEPAEDESLYNYDVTLAEKLKLRNRLSASERSVVVFAKVLAYGSKLKLQLKRKITR